MPHRSDQNDFYVAPPQRAVRFAPAESWFVYRGPPSRHLCVAVCPDRERAIEHAVHLAQTRSATGAASQVHVPASPPQQWTTVWHAAGTAARHGETQIPRRQA